MPANKTCRPAPGISPARRISRSPDRTPLPMLQAGLDVLPDRGCLPMQPNAPLLLGPGLSLQPSQAYVIPVFVTLYSSCLRAGPHIALVITHLP